MRKQLTFTAAIIAAVFVGLVTSRASFADDGRHGDGYRTNHAVVAVLGTLSHLAKGGRNGYDAGYAKHDGYGGKHGYGGHNAKHRKHDYRGHQWRRGHLAGYRQGHHSGRYFAGRRCHQVSKVRHNGYGAGKLIVGTMCYDRHGNGYIVPGSRYVARRF